MSQPAPQHVVHCCHVVKYITPISKDIKVFASPPLEDVPPIHPIEDAEERIYSVCVCDAGGKLLRRLLFFESDYREALKRDLKRRLATTT